MTKNCIRGEIYHAIHQCATVNNKYMENCDKNKESLCLTYWDVYNLYGWATSQNLPVDGFKWVENTSQFNKDFTENYYHNSDEGYSLEAEIKYPEELQQPHNNLPVSPEGKTCSRFAR